MSEKTREEVAAGGASMPLGKLTIQVTRTASDTGHYVQILSEDQFSVRLVLIAEEIVVDDARPPAERGGSGV